MEQAFFEGAVDRDREVSGEFAAESGESCAGDQDAVGVRVFDEVAGGVGESLKSCGTLLSRVFAADGNGADSGDRGGEAFGDDEFFDHGLPGVAAGEDAGASAFCAAGFEGGACHAGDGAVCDLLQGGEARISEAGDQDGCVRSDEVSGLGEGIE